MDVWEAFLLSLMLLAGLVIGYGTAQRQILGPGRGYRPVRHTGPHRCAFCQQQWAEEISAPGQPGLECASDLLGKREQA